MPLADNALSFPVLLSQHVVNVPDKAAIIDRDNVLSFAEVDARSRALAGGLSSIGVKRGDRVAVWLPNSAAWLLTFLACAHLGATVFAVNTRFRAHEVQDIIDRGRTDWLVLWPDFKGIAFSSILAEVDSEVMDRIRGIVCYTEAVESVNVSVGGRPVHRFSELVSFRPCLRETEPGLGAEAALVFTTSGTTSLPKFVVHSQSSLIVHGKAVAESMGYDHDSRVLGSTPFCGAFGFATMISALASGASIVSQPVFDAAAALDAVRRHRVTHTFANNEAIARIIENAAGAEDFASVRFFGFASFAPSMGSLLQRAEEYGLNLCGLYGSSELNALCAAQPRVEPHDALYKYRHLAGGRLVHPQARVRSWDPERGVLPHGEPGEIQVSTPCAMIQYLDRPDATADAFTADGYFRTGDLGVTIAEDHFVFHSRLDDSIRLSGFLVNPVEIEGVIDTLPGVASSQVVEAPDGKTVVAFVIVASGFIANETEWKLACKQRMAGYKVPSRFFVIDEFPTVLSANAVKIQKNRLRDMARSLSPDSEAS